MEVQAFVFVTSLFYVLHVLPPMYTIDGIEPIFYITSLFSHFIKILFLITFYYIPLGVEQLLIQKKSVQFF